RCHFFSGSGKSTLIRGYYDSSSLFATKMTKFHTFAFYGVDFLDSRVRVDLRREIRRQCRTRELSVPGARCPLSTRAAPPLCRDPASPTGTRPDAPAGSRVRPRT